MLLAALLSVSSCARMGNPDGGWYDDTPPRVVSSSPNDKGTHVKQQRITIDFDEFIKLEDAQSKVIISPPQLEQPDIKASGRRIIVNLLDSLKSNTTYTIDFSDAITDNNEGNPMGNYTFSFSTGAEIDTFEVAGYVLNASDLEPVKGTLVGLYSVGDTIVPDTLKDDSIRTLWQQTPGYFFHRVPMARVSRSDSRGHFVIKGVAPGEYIVRALQDADGDYVFSQKSEAVAFSHDIVKPSSKPDVRQDTVWRDSLRIDNILRVPYTHFLPDDICLRSFQEPQTDRYLLKTERSEPNRIRMFFTYGSDSLPKLRGLNFDADSAFIVEASPKRDTITYWLRDTLLINQDTLKIERQYLATDTNGILALTTDTIEALPKVSYEKRLKAKQRELEQWQKEQDKKRKKDQPYDTIPPRQKLTPKLSTTSGIAPTQSIFIDFTTPLTRCDTAAFHLSEKVDSLFEPRPFRLTQERLRTYRLIAEWEMGKSYTLEIDSAAFEDIYGLTSDRYKADIKVNEADNYSTLTVNVSGLPEDLPPHTIIVELLDKSDKAVTQQPLSEGSVTFFYLNPGTYYLRAFTDFNGNGLWDTGCYDEGQQPELVFYSNEPVECKAKWDVSRNWNVTSQPLYLQKPDAVKKQKAEKQKQLRNRNADRAKEKGIPYPGQNIKI